MDRSDPRESIPVNDLRGTAQSPLTPTQMRVLKGVQSGMLNKQIAFDLGIAEATVKAHMTALMRKLKVRNRTQVAIAAEAMEWRRGTLAH